MFLALLAFLSFHFVGVPQEPVMVQPVVSIAVEDVSSYFTSGGQTFLATALGDTYLVPAGSVSLNVESNSVVISPQPILRTILVLMV